MFKNRLLAFILILSVAANVVLIYFWKFAPNQITQKRYPFLSSLAVDPDYPVTFLLVNFLPLRQELHAEIDPYASASALYFEYLPSGTSIGINEDKEFTGQSLLKTPVVMAYFHMKERLNMQTDPTVQIKASELNDKYGDLYKKGAGYHINLSDAVKLALQESDNTASLILADQISQQDFDYVYEGLDIPEKLAGENPIITAQEYASIFKALYYGSVLSNDHSEYILDLLTKTKFSSLLPSGVPNNVPVAHKIGLSLGQIYQDCGIVYVPMRPYILCMVSRSDYPTALTRMHKISAMVYDYVAGLKSQP